MNKLIEINAKVTVKCPCYLNGKKTIGIVKQVLDEKTFIFQKEGVSRGIKMSFGWIV